MNFCDKSDMYISLYIDQQLDHNDKEEFLKHLDECPDCAQKLKEESYFVQLCNSEEAVELPKDFSAALHSRLIEISQKEHNSNKKLLFFNKKLMTAVSTAAVVVISLLAYRLIPEMGLNKGDFSESAAPQATIAAATSQIQTEFGESAAAGANSAADEDNATSKSRSSNDSENSDTAVRAGGVSQQAEEKQQPAARQETIVVGGTNFVIEKSTVLSENVGDIEIKAARKTETEADQKLDTDNMQDSDENVQINPEPQMAFTMAKQVDEGRVNIFSNYVEMTLTVLSVETEVEVLNRLMTEHQAVIEESGLVNGFSANVEGTSAYIDYSIPLSVYGSLQSEALLKYKLELKAKTDIIKKDITEEYNDLEIKIKATENKISEALSNGQETTALEAEKSNLIAETNQLLAKEEMITVRIFFVIG